MLAFVEMLTGTTGWIFSVNLLPSPVTPEPTSQFP